MIKLKNWVELRRKTVVYDTPRQAEARLFADLCREGKPRILSASIEGKSYAPLKLGDARVIVRVS